VCEHLIFLIASAANEFGRRMQLFEHISIPLDLPRGCVFSFQCPSLLISKEAISYLSNATDSISEKPSIIPMQSIKQSEQQQQLSPLKSNLMETENSFVKALCMTEELPLGLFVIGFDSQHNFLLFDWRDPLRAISIAINSSYTVQFQSEHTDIGHNNIHSSSIGDDKNNNSNNVALRAQSLLSSYDFFLRNRLGTHVKCVRVYDCEIFESSSVTRSSYKSICGFSNERCRPSYSVTLWDERQIIAFPEEAISKSALRKDPFGYLLEPFYVHS